MRSITTRILKLEQMHPPSRDCRGCGYPSSGQIRVVVTENSDPLPTCPTCERPLDDDGAPLHTPFKWIILPREHGECLP